MISARRLFTVFAALTVAGPGWAFGQSGGPIQAIDLGGLDTRSAALMLSAQEAGDLKISALALPLPTSTGDARVTLIAEANGASLLEAVPETTTELITEIYAYALEADGGLVATLTQAFRLDLGSYRQTLAAGGLKFFGDLELPVGDYSLRVLVLQRSSGRLGLRILPLSVPTWDDSPRLLPPVHMELAAGWIRVQAEGSVPAFPITFGDQAWLPSARRLLDSESSAHILLLGKGLGNGLRGQLLDADHQPLADVGLGDLQPAAGEPADFEALAAQLETSDIDADEIRLRVSTVGATASADSTLWRVISARNPILATADQPGLKASQTRSRRARLERHAGVREAYSQTLDRLEAGERGSALEPLIELEGSRVGSGSVDEQTRLAQAELEIAYELAGSEPDRLLTMIWIHEELYRRYHRHKRYLLATHSRQVVHNLGKLYLEKDPSPRAQRLVANAQVSVGGYLHETGSLMAAASAYHKALTHDPQHTTALVGLAEIQESYGQYEAAADLLKQLHKLRPDDTRVRLRLGVNLSRLEKPRRAIPHLEAAIADPGPDWVAAVAAQELANLHAIEGRIDEALQVLEAAVERHPDVQRLRIQFAALLDRAGRRTDALAALGQLDPSVGADVSSPRLLYSRANTGAISTIRRSLAEAAKQPLAALASSARPAPEVMTGGGSE